MHAVDEASQTLTQHAIIFRLYYCTKSHGARDGAKELLQPISMILFIKMTPVVITLDWRRMKRNFLEMPDPDAWRCLIRK